MIIKPLNNTTTRLRLLLESEGYFFPCGGKGLCGKCRITAPDLPITELDKRFISESELKLGVRLACNKEIAKPLEILEITLPKASPTVKLHEGNIIAILYPDRTELTLVDNEEGKAVESLFLPTATDTNDLRAIVGKNSVELFEKYGLATAPTVMIAGDYNKVVSLLGGATPLETGLNAVDFALPGDAIYLVPSPENVNSAIALESVDEDDGTLIVEIDGNNLTYALKGEKNAVKSFNFNAEEDIIKELKVVSGFIKISVVSRGNADKLASLLGATVRMPNATETAINALNSLRKRVKIRRLFE